MGINSPSRFKSLTNADLSQSIWPKSVRQGERFGVELLVMDVDERGRLNRFLEAKLPLELEFQDSHTELTIRAAD